jgi:hypothetical protein
MLFERYRLKKQITKFKLSGAFTFSYHGGTIIHFEYGKVICHREQKSLDDYAE